MALRIAFFSILFLLFMHYIGYFVLMYMKSFFMKKDHSMKDIYPFVSMLTAAYNEEKVLKEKIENLLSLDYPPEKIEFIFITDGSNDASPYIIKNYQKQNVKLLHDERRSGKMAALNRGIKNAVGEIIVFTDANNFLGKNAVKYLVKHFADKKIGGVSGEKYILKDPTRKASEGDSLYWKYESALKKLESESGSIMCGDGEIFAVRKELLDHINEKIINDDMAISLCIINKGYRIVYDNDVKAEENASFTFKDDFNIKVRIVIGGLQALVVYRNLLLNPFKIFSIQFFFHKVLRWFSGLLTLLLLILNMFLLNNQIFLSILYLQLFFYFSASIGFVISYLKGKVNIFYFPFYLLLTYFASITAISKFFLSFFKPEYLSPLWEKADR